MMLKAFDRMTGVSIHAPARGATRNRTFTTGYTPCFNPRSREGSDTLTKKIANQYRQFQSTLPRGERLSLLPETSPIIACFNPRSREGSDRD